MSSYVRCPRCCNVMRKQKMAGSTIAFTDKVKRECGLCGYKE